MKTYGTYSIRANGVEKVKISGLGKACRIKRELEKNNPGAKWEIYMVGSTNL